MAERPLGLLDTNVLVYAVSVSPQENQKRAIARELLQRPDVSVCTQVLHEFFNVMTRKVSIRVKPAIALAMLDQFDAFPSVDLDRDMVKRGAALSITHGLSYWDGAIIAAAERLGAKVLYSEDMTHGRSYGSVCVMNPFLASPGAPCPS